MHKIPILAYNKNIKANIALIIYNDEVDFASSFYFIILIICSKLAIISS